MFVHKLADVAQSEIGEGSRVWQYAVILKGAKIGKDCNVCAHTLIEGDVTIGGRDTIKSGVFVWDGTRIEDDIFVGPNTTFTNVRHPRSRQYPEQFDGITIKRNASIGANATLLPGITIGEFAMVGAGAVVTKDVPAYAVVVGNPAKVIRFISKEINKSCQVIEMPNDKNTIRQASNFYAARKAA